MSIIAINWAIETIENTYQRECCCCQSSLFNQLGKRMREIAIANLTNYVQYQNKLVGALAIVKLIYLKDRSKFSQRKRGHDYFPSLRLND